MWDGCKTRDGCRIHGSAIQRTTLGVDQQAGGAVIVRGSERIARSIARPISNCLSRLLQKRCLELDELGVDLNLKSLWFQSVFAGDRELVI